MGAVGAFDSAVETAAAAVGPLTGTHTFYVRAKDANENWGPVRAVYGTYAPCAYAVSPAAQTFGSRDGWGIISVSAGRGCGWATTVQGGAGWLTIPRAVSAAATRP